MKQFETIERKGTDAYRMGELSAALEVMKDCPNLPKDAVEDLSLEDAALSTLDRMQFLCASAAQRLFCVALFFDNYLDRLQLPKEDDKLGSGVMAMHRMVNEAHEIVSAAFLLPMCLPNDKQ